jgi:hypothetical protein
MIRIHGPTYRYRGEILTQPAIIYIEDHYNEDGQCFHVNCLIENSECDPQQHLLIVGGLGHDDILSKYNHLIYAGYISSTCQLFNKENIQPDWSNKVVNFNFMINKPRLHRSFLLMLINHFGLTDYSYSLPWRENYLRCNDLLELTNNDQYRKIILANPVTDIPETNYLFGSEEYLTQGLRNQSNTKTYNELLRTTVFEPSCISLITETLFFERETRITEKTFMAIYGGTIPIWVGGWRIADRLRDLGFDVFDDIVDHSYQDMSDPLDRCYYAVERNLGLLKDLKQVLEFVNNNQSRLQHNLDLCRRNVFLNQWDDQIQKCDQSTQSDLKKFNKTKWANSPQLNPSIFLSVELGIMPDINKFKG